MSNELKYCNTCRQDVICKEEGLSVVCTRCGLELEHNQVVLSLENFDKGSLDARVDVRDTSVRYSYLGGSGGGNRSISDYKQMYKNKVWMLARTVCRVLKQKEDFITEVKNYANMALQSNLPNPGMARLVPACVYLVSRLRKTPLSLLDIADACNSSPFHIGRWFRRLVERLRLEFPSERSPAMIVDDCVCRLINEASFAAIQAQKPHKTKEADLSGDLFALEADDSDNNDWDDTDVQGELGKLRQRVITNVQRLIKMASDQLLVAGRQPGPIAAAATHLVVKNMPQTAVYANLQELLLLTHCEQSTIERRTSEFKNLLLKAAKASLPWATTLTITNIESKIPMIISHLEVEARVTKMKNDAEIKASASSSAYDDEKATLTHQLTLPSVKQSASSSRYDTPAPSSPSSSFPYSPSTPAAPSSDISSIPNGAMDIDINQNLPEITASLPNSIPRDSSGSLASFNQTEHQESTHSESEMTPDATRQPIKLTLGPSTLTRVFARSPLPEGLYTSETSSSTPSEGGLRASVVIKPDPEAPIMVSNEPFLVSSDPPIFPSNLIQRQPTPEIKAEEKKVKIGGDKKRPMKKRPETPSMAPSYLKNANMKQRRANMLEKAKVKLAKLAQTLTAEEAATFGIGRFRDFPIDPKWEDTTSATAPALGDEEPVVLEEITSGIGLWRKPNPVELKKLHQEQEQIERLLMEGVDDEKILTGYLSHQLEALDSQFAAVTEQFTDCTEGLIRTSHEIEVLRQIEEAMNPEEDEDSQEF